MSGTTSANAPAFIACKRLLPALLLTLVSGQALAASNTSDPIRLGIMQGFPPHRVY